MWEASACCSLSSNAEDAIHIRIGAALPRNLVFSTNKIKTDRSIIWSVKTFNQLYWREEIKADFCMNASYNEPGSWKLEAGSCKLMLYFVFGQCPSSDHRAWALTTVTQSNQYLAHLRSFSVTNISIRFPVNVNARVTDLWCLHVNRVARPSKTCCLGQDPPK